MNNKKKFEIVDFIHGDNVIISFVDLCGFTKMVDKAINNQSEDKVIKILNKFYAHASDVIYSYDGVIDKFLGDGIMALYGAIFSNKYNIDNKQYLIKAISSSLKIATYITVLGRNLKIPLRVSTGIWMGDVFMGFSSLDDKSKEVSVIGDPVNVAARLQKEARENEIILPFIPDVVFKSDLNKLIVPYGMVVYYDKLNVKGKGKTLNVFRIVDEDIYWQKDG